MTLILTAICRDGVAICADKRRTLKTDKGIQRIDDLQKLFRFSDSCTLAFNHGINRIVGTDWRMIVADFQETLNATDLTIRELVDRFQHYVNGRVIQELNQNMFDNSVGFVFCAVRPGRKPEAYELFWKQGRKTKITSHGGLIRSGDGSKYLDDYISQNPETNTVEYWKTLSADEAVVRLCELFAVASVAQRLAGGQEFSASYDTDTIAIQASEADLDLGV